jgi:hypothetical protein
MEIGALGSLQLLAHQASLKLALKAAASALAAGVWPAATRC